MLKEFRRERLYEAIAQEISKYVLESGLKAGDRLPSERELSQRLNVSRTSLREAMRLLQMGGQIEIKVGRGVFVRQDDLASYLERAPRPQLESVSDLVDLAEIRALLETYAARRAAERRNPEHVERLGACLECDREKIA